MKAQQQADFDSRLIRWVKLKKYCELSGDTKDAVYGRRKNGIWLDGYHCQLAPDGKLWININKVEAWVTQQSVES